MLIWQAHKGKIESAAFSPDGRFLATATGGTRTVYLWDPSTGQLVRKLDGKWPDGRMMGRVSAVLFAKDAPLLAAGTNRGVTIWRTDTWELVADLVAELIHEIAFGPGNKPMLAASSAYQIVLWDDAGQATERRSRKRHHQIHSRGGVSALDFSPDGKEFATSSPDEVSVWKTDGMWIQSFRNVNARHRGTVRFSPDCERLAFAYGKWVEVWSIAKAGSELKIQAGTGRFPSVWAISWTADGRSFLTAGNDGMVKLWDATTGTELKSYAWDIGRLYCAAFSPDGLTCAACGEKGQVVVWDVDV